MIDKTREAFEHWYKSEAAWHGSDTEMDCGEYTDGNVELAFCAWQGSLAQQPATEASPVTMQQVMAAYSYATEHPHKYLRGTTNWCAAFAHSLNEQMSAGQRTSSATPAAPAAPVAQEPRKDAERYRWLRDHGATCNWEEGDTEVRNHPGLLDGAIDESIAKAKGGEE